MTARNFPQVELLAPDLASQIAAGEVVERPASAIKELVENSLDAGASRCDVEIGGGGISLMSVRDDGHGMDEQNARMALERHATSKLRRLSDLETVTSYGFRGEGLPSIASVSKLRMVTRRADADAAVELIVEGGAEPRVRPAAHGVGTLIEVRDLFYNVPARRKFLRSSNTESGHIAEVLEAAAFSRPEVSFSLVRDGRRVKEWLRASSRAERARAILQEPELAECRGARGVLQVEAYLSRPERARSGTSGLSLFVNGRPIKDRALALSVAQAYGSVLDRGKYPRGVVYLELPPQLVDVNAHPQKIEVRFADARSVYDALYRSLSLSLAEAFSLPAPAPNPWASKPPVDHRAPRFAGAPHAKGGDISTVFLEEKYASQAPGREASSVAEGLAADPWGLSPSASPSIVRAQPVANEVDEERASAARLAGEGSVRADEPGSGGPLIRGEAVAQGKFSGEYSERGLPAEARGFALGRGGVEALSDSQQPSFRAEGVAASPKAQLGLLADEPAAEASAGGLAWSALRFVGQVRQTYLICEADDGLYVLDQHAAAERVTFDRLRRQYQAAKISSQILMFPVTLEVSAEEAEFLEEHGEQLMALGVDVRRRGEQAVSLHSVPRLLQRAEPKQLLEGLLGELMRAGGRDFSGAIDLALATMACHGSVRAGDPMNTEEVTALLRAMDQADFAGHCPHGRPVLMRMPWGELERKVGRR